MHFLKMFLLESLEVVCQILRQCYQLILRLFWWSLLFVKPEKQNRKSGVHSTDVNLDSLSLRRCLLSFVSEVRAETADGGNMCFQHGQDVKPQSDISEIMGFDSSMLKLVLESFVDEVAEESAELILERPRFVHAVVVMTGEEGEAFCQASCIRQLDEIQVQQSVQAATPDLDDFMDRIVREISDSRDMLDYPRYSESLPSSPKKMHMKGLQNPQATNDLLRQLDTNKYMSRPATRSPATSVQFPSMNRSRPQV